MKNTPPQPTETERRELALRAGMPRRHIDSISSGKSLTVNSSRCRESISPILQAGNSVIVRGDFGSGKTHMAVSIGYDWPGTGRGGVVYQTVCGFLHELKDSYRNKTSGIGPMQRAVKCGLLILDELLANHGSEFDQSTIRELIDARYRNLKPTIILTNMLNNEGLIQALDKPTLDRMLDGGCVVTLKGVSQRTSGAAS